MRNPGVARATVVAAIVSVTVACGADNDVRDTSASRSTGREQTVDVEMVDIAFEPKTLEVAEGERVTFRFRNTGKVAHDAFIGDREAQLDHEKEMAQAHGGDHGGDADGAVTVKPGETATLAHTFDEAGSIEIGCHQSGHYQAGMKMIVMVR